MIDNKLHTPEGVKDYLPQECAFKTEVERRIETVFNRYGYYPVNSPTFEYMEVFDGKGSLNNRQMYKFIDRDAAILALRSDMTPAIARIAATAYEKEDIPLRFYYIENAFRYNESYQGKLREFTQAGIELIGINSHDCDAEAVAVAINSLLATGLDKFRIDIGQVQFFQGLLEEACFDLETCHKLQECIISKEYTTASEIVNNSSASEHVKEILNQLPFLIGGVEILEKVKELIKSEKALKAIEELECIYDILKGYKLEEYVCFDLSFIGQFDYYTGIIFRGYTKGTGFSIIDGGRYDKLLNNYGADYPAVGFAIKINDLITALEAKNIAFKTEFADTLIAFSAKGRSTALSAGDELRSTGLNIENSLIGSDIKENIEYAKKKKMGGVLYFENEEVVKVINLNDDTENVLNISQLLNKEA